MYLLYDDRYQCNGSDTSGINIQREIQRSSVDKLLRKEDDGE